jgi:hypothetical protein
MLLPSSAQACFSTHNLNDIVQSVQGNAGRHDKAPPDFRLNFKQSDFQQIKSFVHGNYFLQLIYRANPFTRADPFRVVTPVPVI